jgi:hypothetical protein
MARVRPGPADLARRRTRTTDGSLPSGASRERGWAPPRRRRSRGVGHLYDPDRSELTAEDEVALVLKGCGTKPVSASCARRGACRSRTTGGGGRLVRAARNVLAEPGEAPDHEARIAGPTDRVALLERALGRRALDLDRATCSLEPTSRTGEGARRGQPA